MFMQQPAAALALLLLVAAALPAAQAAGTLPSDKAALLVLKDAITSVCDMSRCRP